MPQRGLDRRKRVVAPHEMDRYADRNIGHRQDLAGHGPGARGRLWIPDSVVKTGGRLLLPAFRLMSLGVKCIRANWLLEILKPQKSKVSSARTNGSAHQIINGFRQDDPTWDTVLLQSRCNIHPVTEHIELGRY
jgi:hypothetical protein